MRTMATSFQLPLSGSLFLQRRRSQNPSGDLQPFNSLSRDHGITGCGQRGVRRRRGHFQLPLSGSRSIKARHVQSPSWGFQLPLSGSLLRLLVDDVRDRLGLSTPSLGITWDLYDYIIDYRCSNCGLSTPSLGITEPDSGIFRLSAAFCRGTSSHK
jgi:hypothetical protein